MCTPVSVSLGWVKDSPGKTTAIALTVTGSVALIALGIFYSGALGTILLGLGCSGVGIATISVMILSVKKKPVTLPSSSQPSQRSSLQVPEIASSPGVGRTSANSPPPVIIFYKNDNDKELLQTLSKDFPLFNNAEWILSPSGYDDDVFFPPIDRPGAILFYIQTNTNTRDIPLTERRQTPGQHIHCIVISDVEPSSWEKHPKLQEHFTSVHSFLMFGKGVNGVYILQFPDEDAKIYALETMQNLLQSHDA